MTLLVTPDIESNSLETRPQLRSEKKKIMRARRWGLIRSIIAWLLTATVLLTWLLFFRPQVLGGPASFVGVSGISMTPTMHSGDLAILEKQSSYHVGEIVAYRIPSGEFGAGGNVIHRIVRGNGTIGFVTKGDHNSYTDHFWHPKTADVIGRVWFHIPRFAGLLGRLHSPLMLAVIVGVIAFVVLAWPTERRKKGDPEDEAEDARPGSLSTPQSLVP